MHCLVLFIFRVTCGNETQGCVFVRGYRFLSPRIFYACVRCHGGKTMENNQENYKKDFVNFLNRIDRIKNEIDKLKEEGCNFFLMQDKAKSQKNKDNT